MSDERERWVVNAESSEPETGLFCFHPIDRDDDTKVLVGLSFISTMPPEESRLVGIYAETDGFDMPGWIERHKEALDELPFVRDDTEE